MFCRHTFRIGPYNIFCLIPVDVSRRLNTSPICVTSWKSSQSCIAATVRPKRHPSRLANQVLYGSATDPDALRTSLYTPVMADASNRCLFPECMAVARVEGVCRGDQYASGGPGVTGRGSFQACGYGARADSSRKVRFATGFFGDFSGSTAPQSHCAKNRLHRYTYTNVR